MYFCLFIVRDEIVEDLKIEKKLPGMKFLYIKKSSIFLPFISLNMFFLKRQENVLYEVLNVKNIIKYDGFSNMTLIQSA